MGNLKPQSSTQVAGPSDHKDLNAFVPCVVCGDPNPNHVHLSESKCTLPFLFIRIPLLVFLVQGLADRLGAVGLRRAEII